MGLFILGVIVGGVVMLMTGILLGAITVEEKDREIDYLKDRLADMARRAQNEP